MLSVLAFTLSLLVSGAPADLPASAPVCAAALGAPNPVFLSLGDVTGQSVCVADCNPYPDVSCQAANCSAQNRNCSVGNRGWVLCNGTYTYCGPTCPAVCTDGDHRIVRFGTCCQPYGDGTEEGAFQTCQNGQWVTTSTDCFPSRKCLFP